MNEAGEQKLNTGHTAQRGITAGALRWFAFLTMAINHFGNVWCDAMNANDTLFYDLEVFVSRAAFVIFAYFIAEGMIHTRSRKKYLLRLFALSLISEFFYDSALEGGFPAWDAQNVVFTLFLGALIIYLNDEIRERFIGIRASEDAGGQEHAQPEVCGQEHAQQKVCGQEHAQQKAGGQSGLCLVLQIMVAAILSYLCARLRSDYGFMGTALILIFYYLRKNKRAMLLSAAVAIPVLWALECYFYYRWMGLSEVPFLLLVHNGLIELPGLLALPLLNRYNGEQGRKIPRWLNYGFYPGHLCIAWLWLKLVLMK